MAVVDERFLIVMRDAAQPDATKRHVPIEDLEFFKLYEAVADAAWEHSIEWSPFAQDTIGKQFVQAADGINLNLAEGAGRYTRPDSIRFFVMGRGSARERRICVQRAIKRGLMTADAGAEVLDKLVHATKLLNLFINYRRNHATASSVVRAQVADYGDPFCQLWNEGVRMPRDPRAEPTGVMNRITL